MGQKGHMNAKQKVGCAFAIIRILFTQPIWYYLLYKVLQAVEATDLMWFLFWVYFPVGIVLLIVEAILSSVFDEKAG
jgi:hypothetical protein